MKHIILLVLMTSLTACAVKTNVKNEYKLAKFSHKKISHNSSRHSIMVSEPQAATGYRTSAMLFMNKPFEISPFAQNAWIGAPADMLYPLVLQTLQASGYFEAVTSSPYANHADYRLDTQLLTLQQNFLCQPSRLDLVVKAALTHIEENRVIASKIFSYHVPCSADTPYGGVLAANVATGQLTSDLTTFTINTIKSEHRQA